MPACTLSEDVPGRAHSWRSLVRVFCVSWLLAFTGAATPGSMLALVIGQVLAQGFRAVLLILLGHALLEAVFVAGFACGAMRFLRRRGVRGILAIGGGLALVWLGLEILLDVDSASLSQSREQARSWWGLVVGGMAVSLSNPYFTGWWATVGSGQVATFSLRRPRDFVVFWVGHELGDAVWYMFVALVLVVGARWLNDSVYRALLTFCGATIALLGVIFVVIGGRCLRRTVPGSQAAGASV